MVRAPRISSILCLFQGAASEVSALDIAFGLARRRGATLRILHISQPPMNVIDPFGAAAYSGALTSGALIDQIIKDDDDLITAAKTYVARYAALHSVRLVPFEKDLVVATVPTAAFIVREDLAQHLLSLYGKTADVIIAARQIGPGAIDASSLLAELLDTGKALLLGPPTVRNPGGGDFRAERVSIAWDGSLQASRAITCALPLLAEVKNLYLLCVREDGRSPSSTKIDIVKFLNAHGLKPNVVELDSPRQNVGQAILSAATELKSDLLVMGAYGHNRVVQMLIGGTSRYILRHAELPLLISH